METIVGIEIFPIISFIIFFIFFIGLFAWVITMKKAEVNKMAAMPLDEVTEESETKDNN